MTTYTGLIIGLTGRLCSGKDEIAQIITEKAKVKCQKVELKQKFRVKEFVEAVLQKVKNQEEYTFDELREVKQVISNIHANFIDNEDTDQLIKVLNFNDHNQILYPICHQYQVNVLNQRNYFHLIAVQTPTLKRYDNFLSKYKINVSLPLFCIIDDIVSEPIQKCMNQAKLLLNNNGDQKDLTIEFFEKYQDIFRSIRPNWHIYFMHIAHVVKARSNCMKRAVGVVVVKNDRIVATGYNGTPNGKQNCWEGGCVRCNQNTKQGVDLEKCFCFHAEENAILEIGTSKSQGMTLYTTLFPCLQCTKIILACGFEKIYYEEDFDNSSKTSELNKYVKVEQIDTTHYVY